MSGRSPSRPSTTKKLVGLDVIYVHRLLKNPVEVPEYLLVSGDSTALVAAPAPTADAGDPLGPGGHRTGAVTLRGRRRYSLLPVDTSWPQRIGATFAMAGRGFPTPSACSAGAPWAHPPDSDRQLTADKEAAGTLAELAGLLQPEGVLDREPPRG